MLFHDRATIEGKARITPEGYLVADAYVARANNIQTYTAAELELTDRAPGDQVRVFRPESEVFAHDSLQTASRLPITLKHPAGMVDATNWRDLSKGETGEEIMRDGDRMRVPLRVTDAGGVTAVRTDHNEFSLGYTAEIKMVPGIHDGQPYDASLSNIRYNHLAAVPRARGGSDLRIVDERTPIHDGERDVKKIMLDGLQVDLSDAAAVEVAITKLQGQVTDAKTAATTAETALTTANTAIVAKDAEIVTLKKQVEDAKVTPQQMRDAAKAYAETVAKGKAAGITVTDAMDEAAIKKAVVDKAMGDAAKNYSEGDYATAFSVLTKDAKVADAAPGIIGSPVQIGDSAKATADARAAWLAAKETAHSQRAA